MDLSDKARTNVLVLDTSALVMGLNPSALNMPTYSVPSVMEELIPGTLPYTRFSASIDAGRLIVERPTPSSMEIVQETSSKVGDFDVLSNTDVEVLALALDLRKKSLSPAIVSDDYAVQNVSETLGIEHASLATFGIARRFDWIYYCPACFRRYPGAGDLEVCQVCGTKLKRKPFRKELANSRYSKPS